MERSTYKKTDYVSYILFALFSFFTTCASPSLIKASEFEDPDSSAFRYMGMLIAKGGIPYRDAFDNKGPLMYFFQFVGYSLNKSIGVYFIEYIFVLLFFVVSYHISKRFVQGWLSLLPVLLSVTPLSLFYMGNLTEEYSMFFVSLGLLIFIDFFIFDKTSFFNIFICGLCFGAVLLIRANMAVMWPVFCLFVIIRNLVNKRKFPVAFSLMFLLGVICVISPFLIWMFSNDALVDFWKDYIVSNMVYTGKSASLKGVLESCVHMIFSSLMEIYLLFLLYMIIKKKNTVYNLIYIAFMLINLYMACIAGAVYKHYGMILIPILIYPSALLINYLFSKGVFKNRRGLGMITVFLASSLYFSFAFNNIASFCTSVSTGNTGGLERERIVDLVLENTDPEDKILVLGYEPHYYLDTDRLCSSRFYYLIFIENYPDGSDVIVEDINSELPKAIICLNPSGYQDVFLHFDDYEKIDSRGVWVLKEHE